jgi:acetolactate synthase-1/2/3 large subunit
LLLSHARREALGHADLVLVFGAPLDFRLSYGLSPLFAPGATLVHVSAREEDHGRAAHLPDRIGVVGSPAAAVAALAGGLAEPKDAIRASRAAWLGSLREHEVATLAAERSFLVGASKGHPLHVYAAIGDILDRDAVVVGDGGDFVSYAGKAIRTYAPGRFLDPGPLGTLGVGPGYALAAQLAHPGKQVLLLLGDGAFGYLPMEFETMARFAAPVVAVVGNNGGQNLERQPMEDLYGYSIAATYEPQVARYHEIVQGMGGHGERVEDASDLRGALERAFASGLPSCINVQLDRDARYPRVTDLS